MTTHPGINHFYDSLARQIDHLGGMHNAHLHLDRAGTLDPRYMAAANYQILRNSHVSLHEKHSLISVLHEGPAYDSKDLEARISGCLDAMIACNTRRADSLVDVTCDRIGLDALHVMGDVKRAKASAIDLRIGAYSPLGFRDDEPQRWAIFEQGAREADYIGALPEADDTEDYPQHIGFEEHCRRMLELSRELGCMLHVHTDQRNEPSERGTERLIEAVSRCGALPDIDGAPAVWAVHMISPSTYDEGRFNALVQGLLAHNIGVICCPSAAVGMRQLRPLMTPTYNCIPRVLELLAAGVRVRIASDNIADICSPSTTANLIDEVFILSAALRYYDVGILAKLATGADLTNAERADIAAHLQQDRHEIERVLRETSQPGDSRYQTSF